jgi:hypothetical protein
VLDDAHVGDINGAFGTIRRNDHGPRHNWRARASTLLAILGPGLIVMAEHVADAAARPIAAGAADRTQPRVADRVAGLFACGRRAGVGAHRYARDRRTLINTLLQMY